MVSEERRAVAEAEDLLRVAAPLQEMVARQRREIFCRRFEEALRTWEDEGRWPEWVERIREEER